MDSQVRASPLAARLVVTPCVDHLLLVSFQNTHVAGGAGHATATLLDRPLHWATTEAGATPG